MTITDNSSVTAENTPTDQNPHEDRWSELKTRMSAVIDNPFWVAVDSQTQSIINAGIASSTAIQIESTLDLIERMLGIAESIIGLRKRAEDVLENPLSVSLDDRVVRVLTSRDASQKSFSEAVVSSEKYLNDMAFVMQKIGDDLAEVQGHSRFKSLYGNVRKNIDAGIPEIDKRLGKNLNYLAEQIAFASGLLEKAEKRAKFEKFLEGLKKNLEKTLNQRSFTQFCEDNPEVECIDDLGDNPTRAQIDITKAMIDAFWVWRKSPMRALDADMDRRLDRMGFDPSVSHQSGKRKR